MSLYLTAGIGERPLRFRVRGVDVNDKHDFRECHAFFVPSEWTVTVD
jgi:hypothetical protein